MTIFDYVWQCLGSMCVALMKCGDMVLGRHMYMNDHTPNIACNVLYLLLRYELKA